MSGLRQILSWMGPLRLMLAFGVLLLLVLRPAPGTPPAYSGWEMLPTLVIPALMPIFVAGLLLDALMGAVWLAGYPDQRQKYRIAIGASLGMTLLLILWWWPYFAALIP
ncbi:MAG: hypothetical protein ABR553_08750 [Gammaproteobacteria bacterium]